MKTKIIKLRDGADLEINIPDEAVFYKKIREALEIPTNGTVDEDHIRMFFYGALKEAVEKEVKS